MIANCVFLCGTCIQELTDGADVAKAESVRKVLRIAVRRASSLPGDVLDAPSPIADGGTLLVAHRPTYRDAVVATDAPSGMLTLPLSDRATENLARVVL